MYWVKPGVSDREARGLRGPVRSVVEERLFPGVAAREGGVPPERSYSDTVEYDAAGHTLLTSARNSDGSEWAMRYTYDDAGRLLRQASGKEGEAARQTVYSYDDRGRLLQITNPEPGKPPTTFRYNENGTKTKLQVSRPEDYRSNMAVAGESPFWGADLPPNMPGGGSATTTYDVMDRPVEVVVRESTGEVRGRGTRTYDARSNIIDDQYVMESLLSVIPPDIRAQMRKESSLSWEELKRQFDSSMPEQMNEHSVSYTYDEHDRVIRLRRKMLGGEEVRETSYNEYGDPIAQITRGTRFADKVAKGAPMRLEYSEARYEYTYDDRGNWIEQVTLHRLAPDGEFKESSRHRRIIAYF